ncbi:MAG: hypothetical protein ASARMPREDX12_000959 [Alectoria sarmentosa]|nr:MAG: hypothetical protein ASARMPREDX12_000959 [Alectoria sarmentosa]
MIPQDSLGGTDVSSRANLQNIDFSLLIIRDENELAKLVNACEHEGFFYLNLVGKGSNKMFRDLERLNEIMRDWFAQPLTEKTRMETISNAHGFKPTGVQSGVLEGSKDGFEVLKIGRQELRGRWALPPIVLSNLSLFDDFTSTSHFILRAILDSLSDGLNLKGGDRFDAHHREDLPSKSTLYFLHYPSHSDAQTGEAGQNMHTDIGSLTLLFAAQWGLQVLSPSSAKWEYVEPRPGHAIVNVADTLRFLSHRRFRSALHRALPIDCREDRYSISYFLRAADNAEFTDSDGTASNARDWCATKYGMYEMSHQEQSQSTVLTGGMAQELMKM